MISKKAVIAGYDMISPLGTDMKTQWKNAVLGKSGIKGLTRFPIDDKFPVRIAGQVDDIDISAYPFLSPRALALWPSPIFKYAMLSVYRALEKSRIEINKDLGPRTAVTFSSAVGGLGVLLDADRRMIAGKKLPPPLANPNSCINMVGGKISILTGATGPIFASITACATGLTSIITGAMLLEQGRADIAICGAVDFALVESIAAGFATMNGAYCHKPGIEETPEQASRPFSLNRRGFVISEGSGAVILTTHEFAKTHGLDPEIEVAGWSMTSDAHHFVAPNFETVKRCISESIADAGISPGDIDSVNAHATSTKIGDKVEYHALKAVFQDNLPPVSANKSMTGHAMGASSVIESIFAVKGMLNNLILPTINYIPDPEIEMDCVPEGVRNLNQEFVLKNAFGFGGCNSCVVFRKI
ncbi:3-oxoacyl-[acyl-carrier-protein] synthase 2, fabF-like [Desulfonema limicola]|uniref:3-oxoacyl-[acyl-carrier-protein] synthase 2, fabF-like n=1 Tax=Desulfonema limicola TaxID=45656 RepID=A0A975GGA4_9BACT|nr:beta-ketoacyl-[acyl-carrier-protein] synthase family protein [Desulfonema limicola]QTA80038.1 3-oxoacyl-[acyl-carrier-protein] synthase 2, fabF-like [Desulfonema limicola]